MPSYSNNGSTNFQSILSSKVNESPFFGMVIFHHLKEMGIINVIISLAYIYVLIIIGIIIDNQSITELADVNSDGNIDIFDLIIIMNIVLHN